MKNTVFVIAALLFSTLVFSKETSRKTRKPTPPKTVQLKYSPEFVFDRVLELMKVDKRDIVLPSIHYSSKSSLEQFREDVSKQWTAIPDVITNVYVAHLNKIYLYDNAKYYQDHHRCMDDSLAHELVHYIQVQYYKVPVESFDDFMEFDAIAIQSQFRDLHCSK